MCCWANDDEGEEDWGDDNNESPIFWAGARTEKEFGPLCFRIGVSLSLLLKRAHGKEGNIFCHFFALSLALISPPFISKQKLPSLPPPPSFSLSFCRKRRWKRKSAVRRKDTLSRWLISLGEREEIAFEIEVGQTWVWGRERKKGGNGKEENPLCRFGIFSLSAARLPSGLRKITIFLHGF